MSSIPMRAIPSEKSEMVNQVLFGETFKLIDKRGTDWLLIQCSHDDYVGWVDEKMVTLLTEEQYAICRSVLHRAVEICHPAAGVDHTMPILIGSSLPAYDGIAARLGRHRYIYNGQVADSRPIPQRRDWIVKMALKYLHAPYLWGGRSPFGIDCSGLVQLACALAGIALPRDASQQVTKGSIVDFVDLAEPGDLAFFDNEEGRITHVGILLSEGKILHASGQVRIDNIDHYGIYVKNRRKYSHKLRVIKQIV